MPTCFRNTKEVLTYSFIFGCLQWKASPDAPPSLRKLTQKRPKRASESAPLLDGDWLFPAEETHSKLAWRRRQLCDRESGDERFSTKSNQLTRSFMWHSWRKRTTINHEEHSIRPSAQRLNWNKRNEIQFTSFRSIWHKLIGETELLT